MTKKKNKARRSPSKKAGRRATLKTMKLVKKLQRTGVIESSGYSLEMPFSKRLSISGTVDYSANPS